ncbi:MAG: M23 family metallopeptidase [Hyphomicrobiales bacterium]
MSVWGLLPGLLLAFVSAQSVAQEVRAQDLRTLDVRQPQLSFASVDWQAAIASLPTIEPQPTAMLSSRARRDGAGRVAAPALLRLNGLMSQQFAGLSTSPVPVLVPFDVAVMLHDLAAGTADNTDRYYSGFHAARFFYPGPAGYDAAFAIRTGDVPEFSDIKFSDPIEVQISGSALLYDLEAPILAEGQPVPALEDEFPGIRRMILEHHLRYTFTRFGVPYVVSIVCFDAGVSRYRMPTCRSADQIAQRFLRSLRVVGGMPRTLRAARPLPIERPTVTSRAFGYYAPGQLASGSGSRGSSGRPDYTAYSQIRFPLEETPAFAISQVYWSRGRVAASDGDESPPAVWRDNFCERRGFPVGQCPGGIGHQGQDIRAAPCKPPAGSDKCTHRGNIVAVRDGVILRSPRQEAAYLFVNSANEHIRFRYLHMNPRKMDAEGLLNGRRVHEGEIIGEVSNFSMKEAGTSYHLHFDVQVPTRHGWVFVNPYMTLVTAYERLIGERGAELSDPSAVASTDPTSGISSGWCATNPASCKPSRAAPSTTAKGEPEAPQRAKEIKSRRGKAKSKSRHRQRVAHQEERQESRRPERQE